MPQQKTRAWFQTTSWSLVVRAQASDADLAQLLLHYWSPVYAYIRRSGRHPADAADLTQEFLSQVVLERDLLGKLRPERGRFRTFLQSALRNFLIDQHRRATARRRSPDGTAAGAGVPRDPLLLAESEPAPGDSPDTAFDRLWATRVLSAALERMEAECPENGLSRQWEAFETAVLRPATLGTEPPSLSDLAARLGAESPDQVSNMIQTIKRRFRRTVREVIAETVDGEAEVEEEMAALRGFLG